MICRSFFRSRRFQSLLDRGGCARFKYTLPDATWSLDELNILSEGDDVVGEDEISRTASLARIDYATLADKVPIKTIAKEINIILNCSKAIKNFKSAPLKDLKGYTTVNELREDVATDMELHIKPMLFDNCMIHKNGYYYIPKVEKRDN